MSDLRGSAIVGLAVRVLPSGAERERYRAELIAELTDLPESRRRGHAIRFALRAIQLRNAVLAGIPWHCRWHLYHHYALAFTSDGHRFRCCSDCGQDDPTLGARPQDGMAWMSAQSMNAR